MHRPHRDIVELSIGRTDRPTAAGHAPVQPATDHPYEQAAKQAAEQAAEQGPRRMFLRLYFSCSNQYARAYQHQDGSGYAGRCPQCGKSITFAVGEGGTAQRSFTISCR